MADLTDGQESLYESNPANQDNEIDRSYSHSYSAVAFLDRPDEEAAELERRAGVDRRRITDRSTQTGIAPVAKKDIWDKIGAVAPIISGCLIFVAGGVFTYAFNQQQLHLQEIQTIEKFIPHLMGNEQSKKAAILAISSLTNTELAGKFASIFASTGTVSALQKIATTGSDKEKSAATQALSDALESLAARESKLSDVEPTNPGSSGNANSANSSNQELPAKGKESLGNLGISGSGKDADTPYNMLRLADVYAARGQYDLAEALLKRGLAIREAQFGPDHPVLIDMLQALAGVCQDTNRKTEAQNYLKRVHTIESNSIAEKEAVPGSSTQAPPRENSAASAAEPPAFSAKEEKERQSAATSPNELGEQTTEANQGTQAMQGTQAIQAIQGIQGTQGTQAAQAVRRGM